MNGIDLLLIVLVLVAVWGAEWYLSWRRHDRRRRLGRLRQRRLDEAAPR